tara:strand:+ start:1349 stop:3181 length:1833 start_codon:yes stop_codon:yes gene_type:complete
MSNIVERLTENIVERNLQKEGGALLNKWESTGLLEGIDNDNSRANMARLLENQAKELLREASSMAQGDVEGFAAVAFPIVRRVFGGLIANNLVSVQPMSLPSGLIFFLDFQSRNAKADYRVNASLYGGGVVGQELTGGVKLGQTEESSMSSTGNREEQGFYSLNTGYASPTASSDLAASAIAPAAAVTAQGPYAGGTAALKDFVAVSSLTSSTADEQNGAKAVRFDPDLLNATSTTKVQQVDVTITQTVADSINWDNLIMMDLRPQSSGSGVAFGGNENEYIRPVRRLTERVGGTTIRFTMHGSANAANHDTEAAFSLIYPIKDDFTGTATAGSANAIGAVAPTADWNLEDTTNLPEIDIKVDSVSVTATTKKLKAKWTPELGQDLNAYHNLDAEVELTSILSEQIALEIDREIVNDLIQGATGAKHYWSRRPGRFLNRESGAPISTYSNESLLGADFTGTVSEWYETLLETVNDVSAKIHRKTIRGGANFLVCGPEVASILEMTAGFRASIAVDDDSGSAGAHKTGTVSKKWDVYVDPYFPRNVVLVGRKGGSFLESGYVYAPYVPLQVTPTIFGPDDFVPRKGVMTRYAKKMVRPDMYGLVIIEDLTG